MEKQFWIKKWESHQIGFHQSEYNPFLIKYWKSFVGDKRGKVFVPMSGKSLDIKFLIEYGHKVIAVELAESAVYSFFEEHNIHYEIKETTHFKIFKSESVTFYCGDFFALNGKDLDGVEFIYDRASLIALPFEIRNSYIKFMQTHLKAAKHFLITISFDNVQLGPPFSVDEKMVKNYYSPSFDVQLIDTDKKIGDDIDVHSQSVTYVQNNLFYLVPKTL